jgi:hypothetical protein
MKVASAARASTAPLPPPVASGSADATMRGADRMVSENGWGWKIEKGACFIVVVVAVVCVCVFSLLHALSLCCSPRNRTAVTMGGADGGMAAKRARICG